MFNILNHHIFVQFLKEKTSSTDPINSNDIANIFNVNHEHYKNSKGFVIPAYFPQHLTQSEQVDTNNINVKTTNTVSKCYVVNYNNHQAHSLDQEYLMFGSNSIPNSPSRFIPIVSDYLNFENGYFVYEDKTNKQIAEYQVNKGVHEDLKDKDYSLQDFTFGYNKKNIPAVPIHPFKHDTDWINYYSSTLSYFIANINFNISKLNLIQKSTYDCLLMFFTDEQNRLFAVTYLHNNIMWHLKNNEYSVNIKYIYTKDRLDPLMTNTAMYNQFLPNYSSNYAYKINTDIEGEIKHINNHVNVNNSFHFGITKVIDGTISETTDNKYIQTLESIRTIPSQLKDSKKRIFIDNHNYLYAQNANVQSFLHYNFTFIPPNIEDVRKDYATADGIIKIPEFIIKDLNAERPNIKYLYVIGSEHELNQYKLNTEMYIMNYRNSYSSIFPDNKGYDILKTKLKVLNTNIGNAYTISSDIELQEKPSFLLQKLNKELKLDSFRENVDNIKEYLIDNNLMKRVNDKGDLNFFKVIGFIKDGAYYLLSNYHFGTEQDINQNLIKRGDDFENVNFICYSIALDFYPRLNNVTSVREKTPLQHNNLSLMTSKKFYNGVTKHGALFTQLNTVSFKVNGVNYSLHHGYLLNDNLKINDPNEYINNNNYVYNSISYNQLNDVKENYQYLGYKPFEHKTKTPTINYFTNDKYSVSVTTGKDNDYFTTDVTVISSNYNDFWDNSSTIENYNNINAIGYNGYKVFHVGINIEGDANYGRIIYYTNGNNTGSNEYINNAISNVAYEKYMKIPALATINTFNDSLINTITLGYGNTPSESELIQTHSIAFKYTS